MKNNPPPGFTLVYSRHTKRWCWRDTLAPLRSPFAKECWGFEDRRDANIGAHLEADRRALAVQGLMRFDQKTKQWLRLDEVTGAWVVVEAQPGSEDAAAVADQRRR